MNRYECLQAIAPLLKDALVIANLAAVLGFGVLAFSPVPVLAALGMTIAPGAFMALLFSASLAAPQRPVAGS